MNYRWINGWEATDDEWERIELVLVQRGWMSLNRQTTKVRVAEENGQLVGFVVLQLVLHTEPLWVERRHWGTGVAEQLADDMMGYLQEIHARGWMATAENPVVARMCEERGMTKLTAPVYVKVGMEKV